jgi:hypothetical protein
LSHNFIDCPHPFVDPSQVLYRASHALDTTFLIDGFESISARGEASAVERHQCSTDSIGSDHDHSVSDASQAAVADEGANEPANFFSTRFLSSVSRYQTDSVEDQADPRSSASTGVISCDRPNRSTTMHAPSTDTFTCSDCKRSFRSPRLLK